jgi:exo-beta-1,3-glucanase (GH17 family)
MRSAVAAVTLLACVHASLWYVGKSQISAPDFEGQLSSVSYAPFEGAQHPDKHQASGTRIRADLRMLAPYTRAIRTYSSTGGVELVPSIANEFGLKATIGAWIDKNEDRNEREMRSVIEARAAQFQRRWHRGRQRNDLPRASRRFPS